MCATYKLAELDIQGIKRFTAKYSEDKISVPGAKQVFRAAERDVIARSGECGNGEALLRPVILGGKLVGAAAHGGTGAGAGGASPSRSLAPALRELGTAEPRNVIYSRELRELIDRTRRNLIR